MKNTMKKLLVIVFAVLIFAPSQTKAQEAGNLAYEINDLYAHAGISFGYFGYGWVGSRYGFSIPLTASVEYGFHEYLSVGGFLGFANWRYEYNYLTYSSKYRWTYVSFGGRGTFHFAGLMNDNLDTNIDLTKFDLYASVIAGLEVRSFSADDSYYDYGYSNTVHPVFGPFLGAKYMFNDKIGIYLEGGRTTYGWGTIGVSAKFN